MTLHVQRGLRATLRVPLGLRVTLHVPLGLRLTLHVPLGLRVTLHVLLGLIYPRNFLITLVFLHPKLNPPFLLFALNILSIERGTSLSQQPPIQEPVNLSSRLPSPRL